MNKSVIIKSFPHGISVFLDAELPMESLLEEVALKFRESSHFFKNARLALSLEGRSMTDEEERMVIQAITDNSEIHVLCLVSRDPEADQNYFQAVEQCSMQETEEEAPEENDGNFYRGNLKKGHILETESSIIVLGDVLPGSSIISTRDIIILGGLYGEAYAGGNGDPNHFIVALEMSPEKLQIGDFKDNTTKKKRWFFHQKLQPQIAYVKENKIVMESITKELLSHLCF